MTLPDITHDCPDAHAEIYMPTPISKYSERNLPEAERRGTYRSVVCPEAETEVVPAVKEPEELPEKKFAIGCIVLAIVVLIVVEFILPLWH